MSNEEIREIYGEDPAPADSVDGTLCNLTRSHLEELVAQVLSEGMVDDGMLRLAALSLSDDLSVWEGIAWQYPDLEDDLETARQIYAHWEYSIGLADVGDLDAAIAELSAAEDLIANLPDRDVAQSGC